MRTSAAVRWLPSALRRRRFYGTLSSPLLSCVSTTAMLLPSVAAAFESTGEGNSIFSIYLRWLFSIFCQPSNHPPPESYRGTITSLYSGRTARLVRFLSTWCQLGVAEVEDAVQSFDVLMASKPPPETYTLNLHLKTFHKSGKHRLLIYLYHRMVHEGIVTPDAYTNRMLISSYCRMGRVDLGLGLLGSLLKQDGDVNTIVLTTLIEGLCSADRVEDASRVIQRMPELGCLPDVVTYGTLITGFCRRGREELGFGVFGSMLKFGINPDVAIFGSLIDGFCRKGRFADAMALFKRMEAYDPDVMMYTTLINCCCRMEEVELGLGLLGDSLKKGCQVDSVVLGTLISGMWAAGRYSDASLWMRSLRENGYQLDSMTYDMLIGCCCCMGQVNLGLGFLADMLKAGCQPDAVIFTNLMNGLLKANRMEDALVLFERMSLIGCQPDVKTYTTFLNGLFQWDHNMAIEFYLKKMRSFDSGCMPDVITYSIVIDNLCKQGNLDEALLVLQEMLDSGYSPNAVVLSILMDSFCKQHRIEEARLLFDLIPETGQLPDCKSHTILIHGYCLIGQMDSAAEIFESLITKGLVPDLHCYSVMINGHCENGKLHEALKMFTKMTSVGLKPDIITCTPIYHALCRLNGDELENFIKVFKEQQIDFDIRVLNLLIDALCKRRRVGEAHELLDWATNNGKSPDLVSYNSLMSGYCSVQQLNKVNAVFQIMCSQGFTPDATSYSILIHSHCISGKFSHARDLFDKMIKGLSTDVVVFNTLLMWSYHYGEVEYARQLFDQMSSCGVHPDSKTYITMLNGLLKNECMEEALELYYTICRRKFKQDIEFYNILIDWLFRARRTEAAKSLFQSIVADGLEPNMLTRNIMIKHLVDQGQLDEANKIFFEAN